MSDAPRTTPVEPRLTGAMAKRRERILEAARAIIARQGIEGLTMRQLASRSQVTVPTLYNLVGGRDRVILEAVRDQTQNFLEALALPVGADPAGRVLAVADACTREFLDSPEYYRSLLSWLLTSSGAAEVRQEAGAALTREFRIALRALAETGGLVSWVDPSLLARRMAAHMANASLEWAVGQLTEDELQAMARFETALALRAVACDPAIQKRLDERARDAQRRLAGRAARTRSRAATTKGGAS